MSSTPCTSPRAAFLPGRRAVVGAAALVPLGAALAACGSSGSDAPALPGSGGSDAGGGNVASDYDDIIAGGPVAEDADVTASPWASAIRETGKLRRGGTTTGQIFSLKDPSTGKVTGFDAGITQLLAQYILGKDSTEKIEYLDTTVETRETMLQNDTVDVVVATYSITAPRMEKINFAGPYYSSGAAIQVRADDDSITSVEDLEGKKITTESASTGYDAIMAHVPNAKDSDIQQFAENDQCMAALTQKRVDAYVLDQSILMSNAVADDSLKVVGEPFTKDPYGIGLSKEHADSVEFVNGFLQKIYDDGTWAKLWKATVGQVVEGDAPQPPTIGDTTAG